MKTRQIEFCRELSIYPLHPAILDLEGLGNGSNSKPFEDLNDKQGVRHGERLLLLRKIKSSTAKDTKVHQGRKKPRVPDLERKTAAAFREYKRAERKAYRALLSLLRATSNEGPHAKLRTT